MYIVIAGGGTVGFELVRNLVKSKQEIVIIEQEREICDDLFANFGVETICGDATRVSILQSAGMGRADMAIATMRDEAANLAFSVLARSFDVPEVLVRMENKAYLEAYKTAGVTRVLNMVDNLVEEILYQIEKPEIQRVARLGDGAVEIILIKVPEQGRIVGRTISEIVSGARMPEESIIAGVFDLETGEFKVPRGNTRIPAHSELFVITKPSLVKKTIKPLLQT